MSNVVKFLPLVYLVAGAVGVFLIIKALGKGAEVAKETLDTARVGTTNTIERLFPLTDSRSMITHAVWFSDGKQHAVPGESVDSDGYFTVNPPVLWAGRYRLLQDASGRKTAASV